MTYVIALLAGLVGAVLGYVVSGAATAIIGEFLGVSNFEGSLGMLAFFGVAPIGGFIGLVVGVWLALRQRGHRGGRALSWRIPSVLAGIAALVASGSWLAYDMRPMLGTSSSGSPRLDFEIRLPPGTPVLVDRYKVQMNTERNSADGTLSRNGSRLEGDRPVITGSVDLYYRSNWRLLELRRGDGLPVMIFDLGLSARPAHMQDFGSWRRVTFVSTGGPEPPLKATDADAFEIRMRVVYRDAEFQQQTTVRPPLPAKP